MEDKNKKIAVVALIFALLALTQTQAITNFSMNLIAGTGINITQSGDNYTISATGNITALPDNTKVNKSGDTMTGDLNMGYNNLIDVNSISSDFGGYNPYLGIDFLPDSISINHGLHGEKTTFLSNGVINDNSLIPSKYVCTDSNQNITSCDLPADNDSQYVNKSGDTMTGTLNMTNNSITRVTAISMIGIQENVSKKSQALHIKNNNATISLSGMQFYQNVSWNSYMKTDFSDLRVWNTVTNTQENGMYIEDKVNGVYAAIWFKGSTSIPASSWDNTTYQLRYNNSVATTISNGTATFEFFTTTECGS
jgi:hypothetical protein